MFEQMTMALAMAKCIELQEICIKTAKRSLSSMEKLEGLQEIGRCNIFLHHQDEVQNNSFKFSRTDRTPCHATT
jgi:hypothetical protein